MRKCGQVICKYYRILYKGHESLQVFISSGDGTPDSSSLQTLRDEINACKEYVA
jgi:hypothetical protein